MWFKALKPWQYWALWVPEIPQICGSSSSGGAWCWYGMYKHIKLQCRRTQKPNLYEAWTAALISRWFIHSDAKTLNVTIVNLQLSKTCKKDYEGMD